MYNFNAEVSKVLRLVIHSLYTNKDVFLRELISNASDACEKTRYLEVIKALKDNSGYNPKIIVSLNEKEGYVSVKDNGIGMNKDELINHLGTIAKSGTEDFLKKAKEEKANAEELIGQFGVGFYSCFMVSDKVEVRTKRRAENIVNDAVKSNNTENNNESDKGYIWKSNGVDGFEITEDSSLDYGTEIIVYIKDSEKEDYLNRFKVENIIKTYSNHISVPIEFCGEKDTITQINPEKALWLRNKHEITKEQYTEFYRSVCHMPSEPYITIHSNVEGSIEFKSLLFIPTTKPFDLYHPDMLTRIKLYVRHVFISEQNIDIIPHYLRFVYGVVDSSDLPLNVSRETLQNNKILSQIKDTLVKKVFHELKDKMQNDKEGYDAFWNNFGPVLKEGLCDGLADRESLMQMTRFYTSKSKDKLISFDDYINGMKPEQKDIYFFIGEDVDDMMNSPEMEIFLKNDIEVILLTDVVDSFWTNVIHDHKGKDLKSITRADIDLSQIDKNTKKDDDKENTKEEKEMIDTFMNILKGKVVAVKITTKLIDSPSCLSIAPGAMDSRMEEFLVAQKQLKKRSLKILEINPNHRLVKQAFEMLKDKKNTDNKKSGEDLVNMIYDLAVIGQGDKLDNAGLAVKRILSHLS